jgi:hypothetical protein
VDPGKLFRTGRRLGGGLLTPAFCALVVDHATLDEPGSVSVKEGQAALRLTLPRQGVSLLVLEWAR